MKEKIKFVLLQGIQGSGKSTFAKQFVKDNQNFKCVNRDSFRHMLSSYTYTEENEKIVTEAVHSTIENLIKHNYNVVLDEMNINPKTLEKNINFIKSICNKHNKEADIEIKSFDITLKEAIERDARRDFSVGEAVIRKTWKNFVAPVKQKENIHHILKSFEYDSSLPLAILYDLDGTMALNDHRSYYDYSDKVKLDKVNIVLRTIVSVLRNLTPIKMIAVSGRSDCCKQWTEEWLIDKFIPHDELYMRKEGDNRSDVIVKKEIYDIYIKGKYSVAFVLDDRKSVLQMWKDEGLYVLDCSQDVYAENVF